jgi:hypothetical protein
VTPYSRSCLAALVGAKVRSHEEDFADFRCSTWSAGGLGYDDDCQPSDRRGCRSAQACAAGVRSSTVYGEERCDDKKCCR